MSPCLGCAIITSLLVLMAATNEDALNCDFEDGTCGWIIPNGQDVYVNDIACGVRGDIRHCLVLSHFQNAPPWKRMKNYTSPSSTTGIYVMGTAYGGKFGTNWRTNEHATDLVSPFMTAASKPRCLSYSFLVIGESSLTVSYAEDAHEPFNTEIMAAYKVDGGYFRRARINIPLGKTFMLVFRALHRMNSNMGVFLDNIKITEGICLDICSRHQFLCGDGHCIESSFVCDTVEHCPDGSDEKKCSDGTSLVETNFCRNTTDNSSDFRIKYIRICPSERLLSKNDQTRQRCYGTGLMIPMETCTTSTCAHVEQMECYLPCPHGCICLGLYFKCMTMDIPVIARSVDFSGYTVNISHLHNFRFLVNLNLSSCQINSISNTNIPPLLQTLDLSDNRLEFIDLSQSMVHFVLNNNILLNGYLSVTANVVDIKNALLTSFNFRGHEFQTVDFSFNNLTYFSFTYGPHNTLINLSHNALNDRYGDYNQDSYILDLSYNHFENFSVGPKIYALMLQGNKMTSIIHSVLDYTRLRYLDLAKNNVSDIDKHLLKTLSRLVYLNVSNNRISAIPKRVFSDLSQLQTLDLSNNRIQYVTRDSFSGMGKLEYLFIQGNEYIVSRNMFDGLTILKQMHVHYFAICCAKPENVPADQCLAPPSELASCDRLIDVPLLSVCIWYISLLSVFGNISLVVYRVFYVHDDVQTTQSIFLINLNYADLIMGIYMYIIAITDLKFNGSYGYEDNEWKQSKLCAAAGVLVALSSELSAFLILGISIERAMAMKSVMWQERTSERASKIFVVAAWIVAIALSVLPLIDIKNFDLNLTDSPICISLPLSVSQQEEWSYSMIMFIAVNFSLFFGVFIVQIIILTELIQVCQKMPVTKRQQKEITIAKTWLAVVMSDAFCWIPIGIMGFLALNGIKASSEGYIWIVMLLLPLNSALNPILYTISILATGQIQSVDKKLRENIVQLKRLNKRLKQDDSEIVSRSPISTIATNILTEVNFKKQK